MLSLLFGVSLLKAVQDFQKDTHEHACQVSSISCGHNIVFYVGVPVNFTVYNTAIHKKADSMN